MACTQEIKQAYIDLALERGGAYIKPNTSALHAGSFLIEYRLYNLTVCTDTDTAERVVLDAYWTSKIPADIEGCVAILERALLNEALAKKQRRRAVKK